MATSTPTDTAPTQGTAPSDATDHSQRGMYLRFGAMILTSTVVMFLLTYTNSIQVFGHAHFSEERLYMALLMGGAMAIIMLGFMWGMYKNIAVNIGIVVLGLLLMGGGLWLSRSQHFVGDEAYMKGMIPHHSIAILTSERANIEDVRVRQLADDIIRAQRKEIKEMEWLISDIEENGIADTADEALDRPVPKFEGRIDLE